MLGGLVGNIVANLATGAGLGRIKDATRPNPYAPRLPAQLRTAAAQAGFGLRSGEAGLAGSEADYYLSPGIQGQTDAPIVQDVTSRAMPPATYAPGDPGRDPGDATVLADFYRGPLGAVAPWGVTQRGSPTVLAGRLNPPTAASPNARAVVAGRSAEPVPDALDSAYSD